MQQFKQVSILLFIAILMFAACQTAPTVAPVEQANPYNAFESEAQALSIGDGPGSVTVMTRNIYVGADVDVVLSAEKAEDIPILVAQTFQQLLETNFPERAVALVKEIAMTQPHLIGLQEVALIRMQSPGDAIIGGTTPAEDVILDYLDIMMQIIELAGLDYKVVGKIQNADVELPMIVSVDPLQFNDVRLTDFDVILARGDVEISDVRSGNFAVNLVIPDYGIEVLRGWVSAEAKVNRKTYRFVNTHLEAFGSPIRLAQALELLETLEGEPWPIIMVGDFNSQAPDGITYNAVLDAGYLDVWTKNRVPGNPDGFTFGHDPDLRNEVANFWERIDFIFVKNNNPYLPKHVLDPVLAMVVGDEPEDRTPSGLWPSDHGGVVARLRIPTSDRLVEQDLQGQPKPLTRN
jgi:hypothetical protein